MLHATSDTRVDLLLDLPCENLSALYLTRSIWGVAIRGSLRRTAKLISLPKCHRNEKIACELC
jgi:hypothetical protein